MDSRKCYICNISTIEYTRNKYKDIKRTFCNNKICRQILRKWNKERGTYRKGTITREFNIKNKVINNVNNEVKNEVDLKTLLGRKNNTYKFTINGLEKKTIKEFKSVCKKYNISHNKLFSLLVGISNNLNDKELFNILSKKGLI